MRGARVVVMGSLVFSCLAAIAARAAEDAKGEKDEIAWKGVWNDPIADAGIRALFDKVDAKEMSKRLFHLSKDPLPFRKVNLTLPGHKKSTLDEADDFFAGEFQSWGYRVDREGVKVQAYRRDTSKPKHAQYSPPHPEDPWYTAYNVYAERRGRRRPEEIIVVMAHKDSQSWIDSPGASDNAIGTCGVLEIARVLGKHAPERTVRFLLCNEEHTPWTSVTAAQNAKKRGDRIIAVLNLDGIGVKSPEDARAGKKTNVTGFTRPEGERLAQLMAAVNTHFALGLEQRAVQRPNPGDDDGSFVNAGYPAAIVSIGSWPYGDPNYHGEGDIPERCDVENAALAVRATLAAILTLDRQP
jgi:hypothetical protein